MKIAVIDYSKKKVIVEMSTKTGIKTRWFDGVFEKEKDFMIERNLLIPSRNWLTLMQYNETNYGKGY